MTQHHAMPNEAEIGLMADVLFRRYQRDAVAVAANFSDEHRVIGDEQRAEAWSRVAARLKERLARTLC